MTVTLIERPFVQLNGFEIEQCKTFAQKVVAETYNRFNKKTEDRIKRIDFGKRGEVLFLKYLKSVGKNSKANGMFEIYKGETNVDGYDFLTEDNKTIDVKTAYKSYHKRILIPYDQFENNLAKDFYAGIKMNETGNAGVIYGYTTKEILKMKSKQNFGEGDAYWINLNDLKPIQQLCCFIK